MLNKTKNSYNNKGLLTFTIFLLLSFLSSCSNNTNNDMSKLCDEIGKNNKSIIEYTFPASEEQILNKDNMYIFEKLLEDNNSNVLKFIELEKVGGTYECSDVNIYMNLLKTGAKMGNNTMIKQYSGNKDTTRDGELTVEQITEAQRILKEIENDEKCEDGFYKINNECKSYDDYNKDLIYIDKNTLLMWQVIPQYSDSRYNAESIASNDILLGYDNWRLPDSKEIRTIYNCSGFKCTPKNVINNKYKGYWTSSNTDINFYGYDGKMFFKSDEGIYPAIDINTGGAVRLVRNIK